MRRLHEYALLVRLHRPIGIYLLMWPMLWSLWLAAEGVQLDRFYVHPICSPTRTALMTGRSPARFGITSPLGNLWGTTSPARFAYY